MRILLRRAGALVLAVFLAGVLAACDDDESAADPARTAATVAAPPEADDGAAEEPAEADPGDADRGTPRDVVIQSVEGALAPHNAKAEWDGDVLRVTLDGDVEHPTAFLHCSLDLIMEDGERIIFVYPNGEADCIDDPRRAN